MKHDAGLDVSLEETAICVVDHTVGSSGTCAPPARCRRLLPRWRQAGRGACRAGSLLADGLASRRDPCRRSPRDLHLSPRSASKHARRTRR